MNEEEKEAIRSAKCEIETEKEVGCIFAKWLDIKELEIILNLIDKLQKENEELKEEINNQYKQYIKDHTEVIENLKKEQELKIRNKIKELEDYRYAFYVDKKLTQEITMEIAIDKIKELLEE